MATLNHTYARFGVGVLSEEPVLKLQAVFSVDL